MSAPGHSLRPPEPALAAIAGACAAGHFVGALDRRWWDSDATALVADIEAWIAAGRIIKSGVSTTVCAGRGAGRDILIKRYHFKGWAHGLGTRLRGSRAQRAAAHAQTLRAAGIATPAPLAWFEIRRFGIVRTSYLVCEYLSHPTLHSVLEAQRLEVAQRQAIFARVRALVERLHALGLTHGDIKPTNFLLDGELPIVIDLDAMQAGAHRPRFRRRRARDLRALAARIEQHPPTTRTRPGRVARDR